MIQELAIYPRTQFTTGGWVGQRAWAIDHGEDLEKFIEAVCDSHWPERQDCVPIHVDEGPFFPDVLVQQQGVRTTETLGALPKFNKYKVTAQYQLLRMTDCWPHKIPKPYHPAGTTLNLQVRGSVQVLTVTPTGMRQGAGPTNCGPISNLPIEAIPPTMISRVFIPISEYHITCDRMTQFQVDKALGYYRHSTDPDTNDWDHYDGCVNKVDFLGASEGTLLWDGYQIDESFAPHPLAPCRYKLTAIFKQRNIMNIDGLPLVECTDEPGQAPRPVRAIGWNHDLVPSGDQFGWRYITMRSDDGVDCSRQGVCRPRYPEQDFRYMFGQYDAAQSQHCNTEDDGSTDLGALCAGTPEETSSSQTIPPGSTSLGSATP